MQKNKFYYISGYSQAIKNQVEHLLESKKLGDYLRNKYPECHQFGSEKKLYQFSIGLKNRYLKKSPPVSKVTYDDKIDTIDKALGIHHQIARVQGSKLKSKREIKIAALFKQTPETFLTMIVVHELAHLKEKQHNRAFYNLCCHMQPNYHQAELDLRLYLTHLQEVGALYD
jgi:predicted metal-dependent hydrolase